MKKPNRLYAVSVSLLLAMALFSLTFIQPINCEDC